MGQKTNLTVRCSDMIWTNENLLFAYTEIVGITDILC